MSLAIALLALTLLPQGSGEPLKDIKNKDAEVRLVAVPGLQALGDEKALKALIKALDDDDWEVIETAAAALAELQVAEAMKPLIKVAVEAPVRRVRAAAAAAAAQIDADAGVELLIKAAGSKKTMVHGFEALAVVAAEAESEEASKVIEKGLKNKEPEFRAAAALALHGLPLVDRDEALQAAFSDEDLRVRVAAAQSLGLDPRPEFLEFAVDQLLRKPIHEVVERRLRPATVAILFSSVEDDATLAVAKAVFDARLDASGEERLARLAAECMADSDFQRAAGARLRAMLEEGDTEVRAAAAHALRKAPKEDVDALAALHTAAAEDPQPRIRRAALASLAVLLDLEDEDYRALLLDRLANDDHPRVREFVAVALGKPSADHGAEAVAALQTALSDADWGVAVCAAVSIGKTRADEAVPALQELCVHSDWRMRGAAVAGIAHTYRKDTIEAVIPLLDDPQPVVARTAHEYLKHVTRQDLDRTAEAYSAWWTEHGRNVRLLTPEEVRERNKEYASFDPTGARAYKNLDIVVLESRGDHIQHVLERLEIPHRITVAAQLASAELHPFAIYVSNCTGEVTSQDIEILRWFTLTGGYLFGSCWSLHHTIARVYPGVVGTLPEHLDGTLVDRVLAEPTVAASPYLEGVFPNDTRPVYALVGAHLIVVKQPERCEVLIDSPDCAATWGNGNLAVWFDAGHGLILDSANHFEEQGIADAPGLKKPIDRMAYAVDHMGLTYARLRELVNEKWWKSNSTTAAQVHDASAFRFITNFVRQKRATDR